MKQFLQTISAKPALEARWLNTVSLLEYIGAMKISKTVCQSHPDLSVLEHFADEARHAAVFKNLSQKLKGKEGDYLCRDEGVTYFQTLDHTVSDWITQKNGKPDTLLNYLLVTNLIEKRAMKLYPLYRATTKSPVVKAALKTIILEENNHRVPLEKKAQALLKKRKIEGFAVLQKIEEDLFDVFLGALKREIS